MFSCADRLLFPICRGITRGTRINRCLFSMVSRQLSRKCSIWIWIVWQVSPCWRMRRQRRSTVRKRVTGLSWSRRFARKPGNFACIIPEILVLRLPIWRGMIWWMRQKNWLTRYRLVCTVPTRLPEWLLRMTRTRKCTMMCSAGWTLTGLVNRYASGSVTSIPWHWKVVTSGCATSWVCPTITWPELWRVRNVTRWTRIRRFLTRIKIFFSGTR